MLTTRVQDSDAPDTERCECDCGRWAHKASGVCLMIVPEGLLEKLYFEDDLNPVGPYPRRVCAPCADHVVYARHRGGERVDPPTRAVL